MTISGINSGQSIFDPSSTHKFTKQPTLSPDVSTKTHDTVSFSGEAKELSQKAQVNNDTKKEILPVEAYALPDWFIKFIPKEAIIDLEGGLSNIKPRPEYSGVKKRAITYSANTASKYLQEESAKAGVTTAERYYMKTSQPDQYAEYDEKLYQSVRMRLLEDEKYVNYMELLGNTV